MNIYWLNSLEGSDPARVGGKAAPLGRLATRYPVPPGFCVPASAYRRSEAADHTAPLPRPLYQELSIAYEYLGVLTGIEQTPVAVRSSGVDEDGLTASFAGQHDTYLNVVGVEAIVKAVQKCWASARAERVQHYRRWRGRSQETGGIAVFIQHLVCADVSAIVFSANPLTGDQHQVVINATWGLGESLVSGTVTPDLYVVRKTDCALLHQQIGVKARLTILQDRGTVEIATPHSLQTEPALTETQVQALTQLALKLEAEMGWPVDLECAFEAGQLFLLQCRPITTLATNPVLPTHQWALI